MPPTPPVAEVAAPPWVGAILGGRVVTKRGDHVSVAPPARRGDLHALTAVGQQLLAVMESDTAVVRVKPRRPKFAKYWQTF